MANRYYFFLNSGDVQEWEDGSARKAGKVGDELFPKMHNEAYDAVCCVEENYYWFFKGSDCWKWTKEKVEGPFKVGTAKFKGVRLPFNAVSARTTSGENLYFFFGEDGFVQKFQNEKVQSTGVIGDPNFFPGMEKKSYDAVCCVEKNYYWFFKDSECWKWTKEKVEGPFKVGTEKFPGIVPSTISAVSART